MSLTIKSCYALRGLYELYKLQNIQSQNEEKNYVSIFNISENTEIPNEFLAKIFSELKRAGIVDSGRGKFGGFNLTKNPEDVKLSEIVEALEVPLNSYDCVTKG
ncbi:MAG TPA: Rrf2 family transcriptional regulator, partial [Defluviitoga sp.]|nr:Rrf2 family transcriptional regulator [Defluviitoga sp.]